MGNNAGKGTFRKNFERVVYSGRERSQVPAVDAEEDGEVVDAIEEIQNPLTNISFCASKLKHGFPITLAQGIASGSYLVSSNGQVMNFFYVFIDARHTNATFM